eukprot:CAMPEP_0174295296 /NCGR_PEP_ID=MMETSP0809-20121228/44321_1 /TAXON_ID=73025 ORGANISM="Eutreptiella gymnastica-like, Strain CCMP1594" /NCGR_SAMPLE_ID=MMETSP0809 /ASSEMBLY_ACC=CAM_ASM_000658 /LENGTH=67 /DNA_ID=CAMNT_0015397463 /DNA_START=525 /DNA_END=724 /DNA_ORIENTATION=+
MASDHKIAVAAPGTEVSLPGDTKRITSTAWSCEPTIPHWSSNQETIVGTLNADASERKMQQQHLTRT